MRYLPHLLLLAPLLPAQDLSLRFFGNGVNRIDRVEIPCDDPANSLPGPPVDVGDTDFTIELWVEGTRAENRAAAIACGQNFNWIYGNILLDRDRWGPPRDFGVSLGAGRPVFGVESDTAALTICASTDILDGAWHHLAVARRRSDGWLWIWIDGRQAASADGPDGDVSFPDDGGSGPRGADHLLVLGAEKHDAGPSYPSFSGFADELRISTVLRYTAPFAPPKTPFTPDAATAGLWHFDDARGTRAADSSGHPRGPTHGLRRHGGSPAGPLWSTDTPFRPSCLALGSGADLLAATPTAIHLHGPCAAGETFAIFAAFTTEPGIPLGPRRFPLNPDALFLASHSLPGLLQGFVGVIPAIGSSTATLTIPPVARGLPFYAAALSLRASAPLGIGEITGALPLAAN